MDDQSIPDISLASAASAFFQTTKTQASEHIKPLQKYVACRLVLEGGFLPDSISPRPPLVAGRSKGSWLLSFDPGVEESSEQIVLGGLKSKSIDVVVRKQDVGPVLAVSLKGTQKAFRNLTNRMEEAVGDCANIHLMYPGLVYGFLHFMKAVAPTRHSSIPPNDLSFDQKWDPVPAIKTYARVLEMMTGRDLVRNDVNRYEAVGLVFIREQKKGNAVELLEEYPDRTSPVRIRSFFQRMFEVYDLRFPYTYAHQSLRHLRRITWHPDSQAIKKLEALLDLEAYLGYQCRTGAEEDIDEVGDDEGAA